MSTLLTVLLILMVAAAASAAPQMLPRDWGAPVSLRQVVVIASEAKGADALAATLKQAGATVEVVAPAAATAKSALVYKPELLGKTLVVLGGIHSNRALMPLYCQYLCFGDAAYPGEDGFTIRTIAAPFGPGTAAITLEASSPAGEAKAMARFGELLGSVKDGVLPATVEAHLPPTTLQRVSQSAYRTLAWALTGDAKIARQGADALLGAIRGEQGFMPYGDYGIERWARECAWLQDAPGVAADEVQRLDQALFAACFLTQNEYWRRHDGTMIGGRHQTMGTSSIAACVQLLRRRGKGNDEAATLLAKWWPECVAYWTNACRTFHDDLEGWPSYCCPEPTLDWAMALGIDDYVQNQLPRAIMRAYAVADPMNYYAGTGTYEECRPGDVYKPLNWGYLLQVANAFHPDAGYDWLLGNFPAMQTATWAVTRNHVGAHSFAMGGPDAPGRAATTGPDTRDTAAGVRPLLGLTTAPLGEYRYAQLQHDRDAARAARARYLVAPLERTFEKLCCRDGFTPDSQYLCLEGFQTAAADNLPPMDANAIIRLTDLGHVWLHSNTEKQGNLPRSAVYCTDGRNDTPTPAGCELQALHSGAQVGLAASKLPDYVACDWTRNVIWRRGGYFVVIDLMQQNREGTFGLIATFRTPQRAWLQPDGMLMREGDARMTIRNADGVALALEGGDELEGAAVPTLLRQTQLLNGKPGDVRAFRNLLFASDGAHPANLQVRPLGQTAVLVRGSYRGREELALIAATVPGQGLAVGGIKTDAQVLYLGADQWAQAGGTQISGAGFTLKGNEGASPAPAKALLAKLWVEASRGPGHPGPASTEPASAATGGRSWKSRPTRAALWRADPFTYLPEAVAAPVLTSEPKPEGLVNTLFDRVVTRWATVRWPGGGAVKLTLDLGEPTPLAAIDFQTGAFGNYNTIPDPATYPAPRRVQAEFSDDHFVKDIRPQPLTFTSDCTFEGLHKGSVFPTLRWRAATSFRARFVRLTFAPDQWPDGLAMTDLSVRWAKTLSSARVLGMIQRDVDGDGQREIIAWSDQAEVAVLQANGTKRWRKQLPGYITAVECFPGLAPDGPRVLVTTREARLYCLKPNSDEAWKVDFLKSAEQNTDLPTGYSIGLLKRPDGRPLLVVGNYNLASFIEPDGKLAGDCRLPAAYQTMTLPHGFDFDGDGAEETISTEVWGVLSVLDTNLKRKAGANLPRGKGLLLDYFVPPTPERVKVVMCTETGLGLFDAKTLKYDWLQAVSPVNACTVGDLNGDGQPEIVLAKEDGFLLVYDSAGTLLQSRLIGEPARSVAIVRGAAGPAIAAAMPGRIITLGPDLTGDTVVAQGEFTKLLAADAPGVLLAAGAGATVTAFACGR